MFWRERLICAPSRGLKTPDAIQAATALALSQNPVFITNDASFARVAALDLRLLT